MLTIEEAEQGHGLLVKFYIEFERLYGIEKVTPNMHMHTQLVECIKRIMGLFMHSRCFHLKGKMVYWVTIGSSVHATLHA